MAKHSHVFKKLGCFWSRYNYGAALLGDGRVLVAGGIGMPEATRQAEGLPYVEIYHPATDAWSDERSMTDGRFGFQAVRLPGDYVLVMGGMSKGVVLKSAEVYSPSSDYWYSAADMLHPRTNYQALALPDGMVLVMGGWDGQAALSSAEMYDPVHNVWTAAGRMGHPRQQFHAALLTVCENQITALCQTCIE